MADFTPLSGKIRKTKFLVLDVESKNGDTQDPGFTRPFMVGVYDGETYRAFFDEHHRGDWQRRYFWRGGCVDQAMRYILQKRYRGYTIYAHNAGRFDYLFLMPWLMFMGLRSKFQFSVMPVASSIQMLSVWKAGGNRRGGGWRFLDSYKLVPIGLDAAAKAFGLAGKLSHDLALPEDDPRWIDYNEQDCVQLYEVMNRFHHYVETVLLGEVGITAPSTSVKLLRMRYLKESIPRNEETHDFVRPSYFGGRTEVFIHEGHGLRYYDINSSYPAAMLSNMPGPLIGDFQGTIPGWVLNNQNVIGFADVDIHVPMMPIPPLPIKSVGGNAPTKLLFPVGNLRGVWEWDELMNAVKCGCTIERIRRSVWYEGVPLFREFVKDLYVYRDTSRKGYDAGLAQVVKIMLNSAYGKFGMKTTRKKIYMYNDPELPENAVPASHDPESLVWYAEETVDAPYIMPQVAARVTALARVALHGWMMKAIELGGKVYYCDTDSIITNVELPTSSKLGDLKDEFPNQSGAIHGLFIGPKMYLLDSDGFERVKAKGVVKPNRETIERMTAGETIRQWRLEKIGTLARDNFQHGPRMFMVPRTIRGGNEKRRRFENGETTPFELEMW